MFKNLRRFVFIFCLFFIGKTNGQVVSINPIFANQSDSVEIIFNASLGNGALTGFVPVYAHTGVITNLSATSTSWRHVVGNWGTADSRVVMTPIGNNLHRMRIRINTFYNIPPNETATALAFVFRNVNGSTVGRDFDGSDIFVPLYTPGFHAKFLLPTQNPRLVLNLADAIPLKAVTSQPSTISFRIGTNTIATSSNTDSLLFTIQASTLGFGQHDVIMEANNGSITLFDTTRIIVQPPVTVQNPPTGTRDGINYINDSTVILQIFAPFKNFVYAIGDFSDWKLDARYFMRRNTANNRYWIQLNGLSPNVQYRYQYHVDQEGMRVGDVYAELQLDPFNDRFIPPSVFPNMPAYPVGKTSNYVSVFQTNEPTYQWNSTINYTKPAKTDLVIYELLIRDFVHTHNFQSLIDTLDYVAKMGANAIKLMPIMEFEGNDSWGYNPAFFFAIDKYYGTKTMFKQFVEACHRKGIAVILDIALNHSFGQNPQVRMWFDPSAGTFGRPTPNNPFFNEIERHPFNVGYDYNHESPATIEFVERVYKFWVEEYRIDGYRLDLSKGYTQNNTLGNVGAWSAYDQSRINILTRIANQVWSVDPTAYMILEHFADNSEERELSNRGMMLWGNMNHDYNEATMGFASNFSGMSYQSRGWNAPNLIGYMESHDEERLVYRNLNFGSTPAGHNTRTLPIALKRVEAATAMMLAVPGPKMIWQFGELGYDFSINHCGNGTVNPNCRTERKPIRWDYYNVPARKTLFDAYCALNHLKKTYPAFKTTNFTQDVGGFGKRITLNNGGTSAVVVANFSTGSINMVPGFPATGWWYDYMAGDSMFVSNLQQNYAFGPGDYKVYTQTRVAKPACALTVGIEDIEQVFNQTTQQILVQLFPNPSNGLINIAFNAPKAAHYRIDVLDITGKIVAVVNNNRLDVGQQHIQYNGYGLNGMPLANGFYTLRLTTDDFVVTEKFIIQK